MLFISVTNVSGVFTIVTVTNPTHHLTCGPLVCGIVEGTAKEELCIKCFNANQAINTQAQKDDLEKEQQQQQPSV